MSSKNIISVFVIVCLLSSCCTLKEGYQEEYFSEQRFDNLWFVYDDKSQPPSVFLSRMIFVDTDSDWRTDSVFGYNNGSYVYEKKRAYWDSGLYTDYALFPYYEQRAYWLRYCEFDVRCLGSFYPPVLSGASHEVLMWHELVLASSEYVHTKFHRGKAPPKKNSVILKQLTSSIFYKIITGNKGLIHSFFNEYPHGRLIFKYQEETIVPEVCLYQSTSCGLVELGRIFSSRSFEGNCVSFISEQTNQKTAEITVDGAWWMCSSDELENRLVEKYGAWAIEEFMKDVTLRCYQPN